LTKARTFESLYVKPILDTLHRQNPESPFLPDGSSNGVFDTASFQTLYLFVDFKTAADELWPAVLQALEPLRNGSWLSTYDGKSFTERAVTVIGTGNTELSDVRKYLPRDVFLDAPLAQLGEAKYKDLTSNEAIIASTNFAAQFGDLRKPELNATQLEKLRGVWDDRDRALSPWTFYWAGSAVDSCWLNKGTRVRTSALVTITWPLKTVLHTCV
jgi:hypothetical protein